MSNEESSRTCTGCLIAAPRTESDYTLISSTHGWRLRRYRHHDVPVAEWWCPKCWTALKETSGGVVAMTSRPPSLKSKV